MVAILNSSGTAVVNYTYDAWGKLLTTTGSMASTLGYYNPLRYRGYVYDEETGLYYLQSRYYNPTWGRFVNADDIAYLGANADLISFNLYAYCSNNPVNHSDPTGHFIIAIPALIKVVIGIVAVAATINDIYQIASGNVSVDSTSSIEDGDFQDNVRISDSYKILTPWMQYGYSFYLNHINDDTKI